MTRQTTSTDLQPVCAEELGVMCARTAQGHELHAMRRRLAAATPSRWADAIVVGVSREGWVELVSIETGAATHVWHHHHLGGAVQVGEPVALHATYEVLAIGREWFSVVVEPVTEESAS